MKIKQKNRPWNLKLTKIRGGHVEISEAHYGCHDADSPHVIIPPESFEAVIAYLINQRKKGNKLRLRNVVVPILLFGVLLLSACASTERTKYTDKTMRVMIDPISISKTDYALVQTALVQSGKWEVVDRRDGFKAIKKEQEREHRHEHDRFDNAEKYSHWGKLYGVGGIVVPHATCRGVLHWVTGKVRKVCRQFLTIVDTNTALVITAVQTENSSSEHDTPDWVELVDELNDEFPSDFEPQNYSERLVKYRKESKRHGVAQAKENYIDQYSYDEKDEAARNQASQRTLKITER